MRRWIKPLLAALCLCGIATGLLGGCAREPQSGGAFRFPLTAEPYSLDPQTATDEAARVVLDELFEGLCALQNGQPVPAAADWVVSEDERVYVFTLREAHWSNGDEVTADDFLFAYERTVDPATSSPYAARLALVETVEAPDTHTLRVTLSQADDRFLETIATGAWYPCPRAFFAQCGGAWGMEANKSLQNGAFALRSWSHGESLLLRRNPHYRAADEVAPETVRFVIGAAEGAAALADGTLDGCALAADAGDFSVIEVADTLQYLWFNTTVAPLNGAAVRRALRDAVEWETLASALSGEVWSSYVAPAAEWQGAVYSSPLAPHRTAPDRAAFSAAVAQTGLDACPTLTLLCAEDEASVRLAQYMVQSWQKHYALYFTIETVAADRLAARLTAGNYHLAIAAATACGDTPQDALLLFDGTAAEGNWSRYQDAAWAETVRAARQPDEIAAAEQALSEACPAVPLAVVTRRFGVAADVVDVQVAPFTSRFDFRRARR